MNFIRLKKNNSKIAIMNDFCFALDFFFGEIVLLKENSECNSTIQNNIKCS